MFDDPSRIDASLESRSISFENPRGARGDGGRVADGRKGAPNRVIRAGERVVLADIVGPGTIRHVWCTIPPAPPPVMRAMVLEVFYADATEPSISVPLLDFFGAPCGRPTPFSSALTAVQEGRGFNAYFPMPFHDRIRIEVHNGARRATVLYFQIDYTLGDIADNAGTLHVSFRRENPTEMRRDFVIADTFTGHGRFLGCVVSIRPIDEGRWYGEGEVKMYLDGDTDLPTYCGTGLEDYVGTAWGMGQHHAPYGGVPVDCRANHDASAMNTLPDHVGFYRWHIADPIVFERSLKVTIQQIGMNLFPDGQEQAMTDYVATNPLAGNGWFPARAGIAGMGLFERVDDYAAAAFVYCDTIQAVPRVDIEGATRDIERLAHEIADPPEFFL
jgi:hypothetical protein